MASLIFVAEARRPTAVSLSDALAAVGAEPTFTVPDDALATLASWASRTEYGLDPLADAMKRLVGDRDLVPAAQTDLRRWFSCTGEVARDLVFLDPVDVSDLAGGLRGWFSERPAGAPVDAARALAEPLARVATVAGALVALGAPRGPEVGAPAFHRDLDFGQGGLDSARRLRRLLTGEDAYPSDDRRVSGYLGDVFAALTPKPASDVVARAVAAAVGDADEQVAHHAVEFFVFQPNAPDLGLLGRRLLRDAGPLAGLTALAVSKHPSRFRRPDVHDALRMSAVTPGAGQSVVVGLFWHDRGWVEANLPAILSANPATFEYLLANTALGGSDCAPLIRTALSAMDAQRVVEVIATEFQTRPDLLRRYLPIITGLPGQNQT